MDMEARVSHISEGLRRGLEPAKALLVSGSVTDVRVLGSIGVVEMARSVDVGKFQRECVRRGVWIRPFGRNVYVMPPYVITDSQLEYLCRQLVEIISDENNY